MPTSLSREEKKLADSLGISYEQAARDIERALELSENQAGNLCYESSLSHRVRAEETGHVTRPRPLDRYNND